MPFHPSIFCRSGDLQRFVEKGLTLGGIQAQGNIFSRLENEMLFLGSLQRDLEQEKFEERRNKGVLGVQVRKDHRIKANCLPRVIFLHNSDMLFICSIERNM